jgi:hypothetical protein
VLHHESGPTKAEDVEREQALENRKRDVERGKKESEVSLDDMTLELRE